MKKEFCGRCHAEMKRYFDPEFETRMNKTMKTLGFTRIPGVLCCPKCHPEKFKTMQS